MSTAQTGAIGSIPTGTLMRTEAATFLVNDTNIAQATREAYRARNLVALPTSMRVKDGAGNIVAQTSVRYDEGGQFAQLSDYGSVPNWTDPQTPYRGNPTTTSQWLNSNGSTLVTFPSGTYLTSHAQYDQCGSVRKAWNARDTGLTNPSQISYADAFSDGVPRNTYAFPTSMTTGVPDPNGQSGSNAALVSTSVFDFGTGLAKSAIDSNGMISTLEYDQFNRPSRTVRASGNGAQSQSLLGYDVTNRIVTGQSDLNTFNDKGLKAETVYDGLGRTIETRSYESDTSYIAVQAQYDLMGRAYKTSKPFRPWQNETPAWTTSAFDALGRVVSVTTPDGALVTTSYSGNTVTVTDQAGKKRRSVTDGLGRLIRVDEPDANGNLDVSGVPAQSTSYSYDTLDNLTTVTQGTQPPRTFAYDSLKRLTSATNPESGTICYGTVTAGQCQANGYDANGNLIYKTDARGVVTTYAYDALNRNTSVTYTNDPASTPTVTRTYDGATNGKGKLWTTETSGSTASRTTINSFDALGRPTSQSQQFYSSSAWSQSYTVSATYDKAGHVLAQTYPSGHTVRYSYDPAGRTGSFAGNLGDERDRTYSTGMIYSALGALTKEEFGTRTPIFNKLFYNVRGQLAEIRESTSYTGPNDTDWNRGAIINHYSDTCWGMCWDATNGYHSMTDNNGNLRRQEVYVPGDDAIRSYDNFAQFYDYDALNRLQAVRETYNGESTQWQQTYTYDRFGNRTIDQDVTKTYGAGINKKDFTVNTVNNRLGVPAGQAGTMTYDNAGNLTTDTYSGFGVTRIYDAENRMISETQANNYVAGLYTYNGDGQRVRRMTNGEETWQVYGLDGALLDEYAANSAAANPKKEYGYRNGQLLITAGVVCNTCEVGAVGVTMNGENDEQGIHWLVTDQLGTPRMVLGEYGDLESVRRHDYLPFGEELTKRASRTEALGYPEADSVRQKFTRKERDHETGLDYFGARYYASTQGRFTSTDPYNIVRETQVTAQHDSNEAAAQLDKYLSAPQQWNRYGYATNNPLKYVDPTGQLIELTGETEEERNEALGRIKILVGKEGAKHLSIRSEKGKDGKLHYYVQSDVNLCDVAGPKDSAKLNYYMSELIDRKDHTVEYKIADSFTTLNETRTTAGTRCGGACTVGAEESTTGNTQIFVNKNSAVLASAAMSTPANSGKYSVVEFPRFTDDIVDAHEFGHAYANAIEGKQLHNSPATNDRAREWENLQRGTTPWWPERRLRE